MIWREGLLVFGFCAAVMLALWGATWLIVRGVGAITRVRNPRFVNYAPQAFDETIRRMKVPK